AEQVAGGTGARGQPESERDLVARQSAELAEGDLRQARQRQALRHQRLVDPGEGLTGGELQRQRAAERALTEVVLGLVVLAAVGAATDDLQVPRAGGNVVQRVGAVGVSRRLVD